jgi:hypothetical protein
LSGSGAGTGVLTTVVVTVGGWMPAEAGLGGGFGTAGTGVFCGTCAAAGGLDGMTTGVGPACDGGATTASGTFTGFGNCPWFLGGFTGVVIAGWSAGSASAGVIPPVSAVNEIAVPDASTMIPRRRQARKAAAIASRLLHR